MDPYREIAHKPAKVESNLFYRFILRDNYICPLCKNYMEENYKWDTTSDKYLSYGKFVNCHPLRRIVVRGFWWWKKLCPVDNIHRHITCRLCLIEWIVMLNENNDSLVKEIYYEKEEIC